LSDAVNKIVDGTNTSDEATLARESLRQLADESGMAFEELVDLWSSDTAKLLARAKVAMATGNLDEAARLAHSASGASGICKIAKLAEELKTAELLAKDGHRDAACEALARAERRFTAIDGALHGGPKP
jgi:HPt (histidine-containing phosphotransfer) domain-containing protein